MISNMRKLWSFVAHSQRGSTSRRIKFRRFSSKFASTSIPEFEAMDGIHSYIDLYRYSLDKPNEFWSALARSRLRWSRGFELAQESDMALGRFGWFLGGQLNMADNCVDRHAEVDPNRTALIWEKDEPKQHECVSYIQLQEMTCRIANAMKAHNIMKGDRVAVYMPNSPLTVAVMLACVRLGVLHNVVFAGFSAEALATRIRDAQCKAVFTTDQAVRGGKLIELKKTVDSAVADCPSVQKVFVAKRTGNNVPMGKLDVCLEKLMGQMSDHCPASALDSEDPSFLLYTSGSTGKPKGIQHSTAGYLLYASVTHKLVFDYSPGDVYACVADIGWITGHSYVVYGPLCNGATSVLFESIPSYPDPGRYWEMVERLKINQFYTSPTAIRLLLKAGDEWPGKYNLSSLKTLGCVGEPLNHEAWHWYNELVGGSRCDLVDTWWQTETGGICISPRPSERGAPITPGMPMRPFLGIHPVIMDEDKKEIKGNDAVGNLCIKAPWPGIARTIYGDHERYLSTYFTTYPGYYFTGDGAHRHSDGSFQITGRTDDVINVSGHRIGTAEIEDAMDEHPDVAESAVIGFPHDIKGEGIYAFIVLKDHAKHNEAEIKKDLLAVVATAIAKFAVPDAILAVPGLPKTRSGKIMRRILRKVAAGERKDLGDVSTLADPSVVEHLVNLHAEQVLPRDSNASISSRK